MKSILGTLALGLLLALAYGALSLYKVSRDKAIAPNEGTVPDVYMQRYNSQTSGPNRCVYSFNVDGNPYGGRGNCPIDGSAKDVAEDLAGLRPSSTATVYYDPSDPSTNSLVDFSVKAGVDYMKAKVAFGLAAGCLLLLGIGVVIAAKASQPGGGIVVDALGTTIYPDHVKSDPGDERFSAHPTHISSEETD